ncbi:unnamed protein product, partial [Mesorhabditis spiculigera]
MLESDNNAINVTPDGSPNGKCPAGFRRANELPPTPDGQYVTAPGEVVYHAARYQRLEDDQQPGPAMAEGKLEQLVAPANPTIMNSLERSGGQEPRSSQMIILGKVEHEAEERTQSDTALDDLLTGQLMADNRTKIQVPRSPEFFYPKDQLPLEQQDYYHGYMNREDSEKIVSARGRGRFLVRRVNLVSGDHCYVLSVSDSASNISQMAPPSIRKNLNSLSQRLPVIGQKIKTTRVVHLRILNDKDHNWYWMTKYLLPTVQDLVEFHCKTDHPIDEDGTLTIRKPIERAAWQLDHEQLFMGKFLGKGAFGEVYDGIYKPGLFAPGSRCAIKTMQLNGAKPADNAEFLHEANVMLSLHHKYIIQLFGIAALKDPIMIVMEIAPGGSLLSKLREKPTMAQKTRARYSLEILHGMEYLERIEIIHRDLAARNILLDGADTVKISDFGLSVKGSVHQVQKMTKVPIRWLAPETMLRGLFSAKSDVWAFGVTVWEIYSGGRSPYEQIKALKAVKQGVLYENLRLQAPTGTPKHVAQLLEATFITEHEARPSFGQLKKCFNGRTFIKPTKNEQTAWWGFLRRNRNADSKRLKPVPSAATMKSTTAK